jgi:hypothetical protein
MACSTDGRTWILEVRNFGRRDDHAEASSRCVLSSQRSDSEMASVVKSGQRQQSNHFRRRQITYTTFFEATVRIGDIRAEDDMVEERFVVIRLSMLL